MNTTHTAVPPSGARGLIAVIDNYDSFTYNLVHYLEDLDCAVTVYRNDEFELAELEKFDKILLSPGPGIPSEAGLLKQVIEKYAPTKSILGVCLGQQAIGEVFGGQLTNLEKVYHGVATKVKLTNPDEVLFRDLPAEFEVGRYHSWVVANENFPTVLEVTSVDENGQIMSLKHKSYDVRGVQYHPESVLTPLGKKILENWVSWRG
ncbi:MULTISPECIES: anthranilate synthase component II [Flavobacterium]|uniref:anthranilate synthase component II n=1 Tax=Flavobacterium TaxID=237 RepID=UPI000745B822|nr:aminodeoxychorismate/anthranilate synthase component II [Flavobacterium covae]AMA50641.1 anthranilate synthase subunit II [Flavobacterium covae]MCJ1810447.1 aminodeoxychorismate/anthranilate synthase component II [Flavobacterium covae]